MGVDGVLIETRIFLGIGWQFPVLTLENKFTISKYENDIEESIRIILGTSKGERVMRPDFGCGIHEYVFETINVATLNRIESSIRDALTRWEPRIDVLGIKVNTEQIHEGKLVIYIDYQVIATNARNNLVYDFYLYEG